MAYGATREKFGLERDPDRRAAVEPQSGRFSKSYFRCRLLCCPSPIFFASCERATA
jgi:hypothetical protein